MFSTILALMLVGATPSEMNTIFMDAESIKEVRTTWPQTKDPFLLKFREHPRTIFYTAKTKPRMFFHNTTITEEGYPFRPILDISGRKQLAPRLRREYVVPGRAEGDPLNEYPWNGNGGLTTTVVRDLGVKFAFFPEGRPSRVTPKTFPPFTIFHVDFNTVATTVSPSPTFEPEYQPGTIFGDIFYQQFSDGSKLPFEVRVFVYTDKPKPTPMVFEPWATPNDLIDDVKKIPDWSNQSDLVGLVNHYEGNEVGTVEKLGKYYATERYGPSPAVLKFNLELVEGHKAPEPMLARNIIADKLFEHEGVVDFLPRITMAHSQQLLRLAEWTDTANAPWLKIGEVEGFAPTTKYADQIVPANYGGGFFGTSRSKNVSCRTCHDTANFPAHYFLNRNRYWQGNVPGGHGNLSWSWFDTAFHKGESIHDLRSPKLDAKLVRAGLINTSQQMIDSFAVSQ